MENPRTEPEKPPLRCPRCRGTDVVPSMPHGFWDEVMRSFGRAPKQCRMCGKRFFVYEGAYVPEERD